jgi:hypothetical protein
MTKAGKKERQTPPKKRADRAQAMKQALRENLHRRKAQARLRNEAKDKGDA